MALKHIRKIFLDKLAKTHSKKDRSLILNALSHLDILNQKLFHSEEKVRENIEVAIVLTDLKVDPTTIIAAILGSKRLLESDLQEIKEKFGEETAYLIENKTQFEKALKSEKKIQNAPIELRKILFFSLTNNANLILYVLADRLSLLRRLKTFSETEKQDLILEQKEILLPIAHKLGVFKIKSESEDLIFKSTNPQKYKEILEKIQKEALARRKEIETIIELLTKKSLEKNIKIKISGRAKSIYSTYRKMIKKNKNIDQIHDIIALRVVCDSDSDCYEMLGIVHSLWRPLQEEFDDYITKPKENNYQALHTTVMGTENKSFEIQIKTQVMHNNAEFGGAAHWKYKGRSEQKLFDKKIAWLNELLSWRKELKEVPTRIAQVDFFGEKLYILSPKGDIIELPMGATVLDFAYAIHDELGNKCVKAKVNQKIVPLNQKLETADIIEVITSFSQKPKMQWLNHVVTIKAKNSIKHALNLRKIVVKNPIFLDRSSIKTTDKRIRIAKCCLPVPGDKIIGFRTTKRKISVHRMDCKEIITFPLQKQQHVSWDAKKKRDYFVELQITANDRVGILKDMLEIFSMNRLQVINARAKLKGDLTHCSFELETKNLAQLEKSIESLRQIDSVLTVERI